MSASRLHEADRHEHLLGAGDVVVELLREGVSDESLKGVHAPIGLDIGAITPQEIAVSIVAELIAAKHGKISEPNVAAVSMRWEGALRK